MEQQLRDEDTGSTPMGLLRSASRFWLQARLVGGPNLLPWGPRAVSIQMGR